MMNYNEKTYYEEMNNYSTSIKDFTIEEIEEIREAAKENSDLFFLAVDWSATINVIKYILKTY